MAAVNLAGFDYELPGRQMSAARSFVRAQLQNVPEDLRSKLRNFYTARTLRDDITAQSSYTSLALLINGPPNFGIQDDIPSVTKEVRLVMGFERLLPDFYRQAEIEALWQQLLPEYEKVSERYRPVLKDAVVETLKYFRTPKRLILDSQIILIPDLLNYSDVVNARNRERVYYIVAGPTQEVASHSVQLQHEYLHFLVDPLIEKSARVLIPKRDLLDLAHEQPNIDDDFRNRFLLVVGESLVESVLLRLHPPEEVDEKQVALYRRGLIFVPFFCRVLADYENTEDISLPEYLAEVFRSLSISEIQKDHREIARIEAELRVSEEKERERAEEQARALRHAEEKSKLLVSAGDLISQAKYDQAEEELRALLALEPDDGNAYFYLGQIANQQKRYEEAFAYYQQAQASQGAEDWVKAWARVRMGKFLAYKGDFGRARSQFEEVIKLEGDLRGARQEALDLIKRLPESPP
jgi:hypothetical protein